jgi:hypothetical protein
LVDFHRLAIPIIVILAVGGIISFFLAHNFYPKKNVNVNIDGVCYEFLGAVFDQYKELDAQKEIRILELQYDAIEPSEALLPISFSGTIDQVQEFTSRYNIDITESHQVGEGTINVDGNSDNSNNTYIDRYILQGIISKPYFGQLLDDFWSLNFGLVSKTIQGNVGLQTNVFLTENEGREIARNINTFMRESIQDIIQNGDPSDLKQAECRSKIEY